MLIIQHSRVALPLFYQDPSASNERLLTARKLLSRPNGFPAAGGPGMEGVKGEEGAKWFILENFGSVRPSRQALFDC